jgi:hypothetical protein
MTSLVLLTRDSFALPSSDETAAHGGSKQQRLHDEKMKWNGAGQGFDPFYRIDQSQDEVEDRAVREKLPICGNILHKRG